MGRQAYLARLALGRSAFEAPLRDENGEFILGAGARVNDDKSHHQEWDDRGHPQNKKSEDAAKLYRMSQNQILEACGVLVKRDAFQKVNKENSKRVSETTVVMSENRCGMMLKASDRILGLALTWWTASLRRRLITFGIVDSSLMSVIRNSLRYDAVGFLTAGLVLHVPALFLRYVRYLIGGPDRFALVDHLAAEEDTPPETLATKLKIFGTSAMLFVIEFPLETASVLDSLGFPLTTAISSTLQHWSEWSDFTWANQDLWLRLFAYLNFRDYIVCNLGWRLYSVFEQCFTQPRHPTHASIAAAEADELVDSSSIPGIGRSSSTQTPIRFFGPVHFRTALSMAFSPEWTQSIRTSDQQLWGWKWYILRAIAEHELESGDQKDFDTARALVQVRIASICALLEETGFQVEHTRFVDFDQWAEAVDGHIDMLLRERADLVRAQLERVEDAIGRREARPRETGSETPRDETPSSNSAIAGTEARSEYLGLTVDDLRAAASGRFSTPQPGVRRPTSPLPLSRRASTPEPGIQRATSLAYAAAENDGRPSVGSVVINGRFTMQTIVRQCYRKCRIHGPPQMGRRPQHRVTRLSLFASSSLAWHASSVMTGLVLLPFDAGMYRLIALTFSRFLGTSSSSELGIRPVLGVDEWFGGFHAGWLGRWRYASMLALTFGLESLVRFGIWRVGVGVALRKADFYQWGSF